MTRPILKSNLKHGLDSKKCSAVICFIGLEKKEGLFVKFASRAAIIK
ncbi:hypothetical protein SRA_08781 [Streptococcus ratti FA-1 = DSM 20564]|uniref:Uncharacterized protein n=1 Tax=Streptococcus ratti FA-1 = DSM 20564 TaxID=699248 RepID=A0ABP2R0I2_STRRT|nr:hypothetical protein SRA_08781 [Streptococcus ratti FA-1 = DSM 20564]